MSDNDQTYTLLVWELVPEKSELYLIPNAVADRFRTELSEAHGKYINVDEENSGMSLLNVALADPKDAGDHPQGGAFREFLWDSAVPIRNVHITHVYLSGYAM